MEPVSYVNAHGQPIDPLDPSRQVRPPRKERDHAAGFHKGWKVVGYPPGVIESARKHHEAERLRIGRANIGAIKPQREPGPWSETAWKQGHKPRAVRSRPYEIEAAAHQCARMAQAAGWDDVSIVECKKAAREGEK